MHPAARATWQQFITKDEGNVRFMYLDHKGLVTVGIGNLIDPKRMATRLPFRFKQGNRHGKPAGQLAIIPEIEEEWTYLKNHSDRERFARNGHTEIEPHTSLELNAADVQRLFDNKTADNERQLRSYLPDYDKWPADAQLALMAMSWGLGPAFPPKWPKFTTACKKMDFATAASECHVKSWRPHRNASAQAMFSNAACVLASPETYNVVTLQYPRVLLPTITITA